MPTDREQLLDMGFEEARVDCTSIYYSLTNHKLEAHRPPPAGALRATKNSGLQGAMDHLIAHGDDAVPDPSVQSAPGNAAGGGGDVPMDEDDEDAEALRAALGKSGGLAAAAAAASAAAEPADAKVSMFLAQVLGDGRADS